MTSNNCKSCAFYQTIISNDSKEKADNKRKIQLLEQEISELKKQKIYVPNNKAYNNCSETQQKRIIDSIHTNLRKTLKEYCNSYGVDVKLLTLKTGNNNHIIDFENDFNRRNVGEIEVNKFIAYEKMNNNHKNKLRQSLKEIQKNNISINATSAMNVNKFNCFSYKQLYDLKKELDDKIPIISISDDINRVFGTYLEVDFALKKLHKIIGEKKR
jgi:hypothetical protein